jgi:hypothetical protein
MLNCSLVHASDWGAFFAHSADMKPTLPYLSHLVHTLLTHADNLLYLQLYSLSFLFIIFLNYCCTEHVVTIISFIQTHAYFSQTLKTLIHINT